MAGILLKKFITEMFSQCINQKRLFWITVGMLYLVLTQITIVFCKDAKSVSSSLDLQCPPCNQIFCMPKKAKRLNCKGGVTKGVCNCCPVCARVAGETCGGTHNYLGKCDVGLVCVPENIINDVLASDYSSEKLTVSNSNAEGICKRVVVKTFPPDFVGDEPRPTCAKKCTAEFCEENPRAICSAINNADSKQECQGECQHTSCRACRYVYDSHPCGKCRKDDFKCMKKFGTCMRKQTCSRMSFPCKKSKKKNPLLKDATFKCTVPECI